MNNEAFMNFKKVAKVSELSADEGLEVEIEGEAVAIFLHNNKYYAIENTCPHKQGPLCDGKISSGTVACPFHAWEFSLETGECITKPSFCVQTYEVKIQDGQIFVGHSDKEKKASA